MTNDLYLVNITATPMLDLIKLLLLQDNKISFWSIGSHGSSSVEDGFEGDPQLLCEHKHDGDVLDLQVRLLM